jgi:hypothetical protein
LQALLSKESLLQSRDNRVSTRLHHFPFQGFYINAEPDCPNVDYKISFIDKNRHSYMSPETTHPSHFNIEFAGVFSLNKRFRSLLGI